MHLMCTLDIGVHSKGQKLALHNLIHCRIILERMLYIVINFPVASTMHSTLILPGPYYASQYSVFTYVLQ